MGKIVIRVQRLDLALWAIVLLGLGLRLWGINFGFPYTYAPDEPTRMNVALNMLKTGDLNPHWLGYPHLVFYLNAAVFLFYFLIGRIAGIFATVADIPQPEIVTIGVGKLAMPSEFLVARGLTVLAGTGAVVLVYLIGREISRRRSVGIISALLFAVSPAAVAHSKVISLDAYGVFFLLLAFYWIIPILDDPKPRDYVLAGFGIGLAFSGKYNDGLIVLPYIAAHLVRFGIQGFRRKELYLGLLSVGLTIALFNPFSVLDLGGFLYGLTLASGSQSQYAGIRENSFHWYLSYLWNVEGMAVLLGVCQAVALLFSRSKKGLVFLSFPGIYLLFISQFSVHNDRTVLPVIPFIDVAAALLVVNLYEWLANMLRLRRKLVTASLSVVSTLLVIQPLQTAIAADLSLTQIDGRETARQWIEANLPAGARVAEEGYSPYIDTRRFAVQGIETLVNYSPDWYVQNGFEYLVFSQGMYGRFFADPTGYPDWVEKYSQFFGRFPNVARFNDNGYEVRIHKTGVTLPRHRIAARFGDYGDLIELVGYDGDTSKWTQGEPLRIELVWRTLRQDSEPLELNLRLLGRNDREIASVRGDLFQGKGWSEGIFSTDWTMTVPADAPAGSYRLQVNVEQTRYAYQPPAMTWAEERLTVFMGPLKMVALSPTSGELQAARSANVQWGDQITLLGYVPLSKSVRAGDVLPLILYWKPLNKPTRDYTVFVHLLDVKGTLRAQVDGQPRGGEYPTSLWDVGEIVRDDHALALPRDLAPGAYHLEIGFYEYPSLARLAVSNTDGQAFDDHWVPPDQVNVIQ